MHYMTPLAVDLHLTKYFAAEVYTWLWKEDE